MNEDLLIALYDHFSELSKFKLGTLDQFRRALENEEGRRSFYDTAAKFSPNSNFGEWDQFNNTLAGGYAPKVDAQSQDSVESTDPEAAVTDVDKLVESATKPISDTVDLFTPEKPLETAAESTSTSADTAIRLAEAGGEQKIRAEAYPQIKERTDAELASMIVQDYGVVDVDDEDEVLLARDEYIRRKKLLEQRMDAVNASIAETFDWQLGNGLVEGQASMNWIQGVEFLEQEFSNGFVLIADLYKSIENDPTNEVLAKSAGQMISDTSEKMEKARIQLNEVYDSPVWKDRQFVHSEIIHLDDARSKLFPKEVAAEKTNAKRQLRTDKNYEERGRVGQFVSWAARRGIQVATWLADSNGDINSIAASLTEFVGAKKLARKLRVGKKGVIRDSGNIDFFQSFIPSGLKGESLENRASFDDDKFVIFKDGEPVFFRKKGSGNIEQIRSNADLEKARALKDEASLHVSLKRTLTAGERSLYDMVWAIAWTRGIGATGAISSRVSIAGTTTVQMFGNEFTAALAEGKKPGAAAAKAFRNAAVTGGMEAMIGGVNSRLARMGKLSPATLAGLRQNTAKSLGRAIRGKLTYAESQQVLAKGTIEVLKTTIGETVEELAQENTINAMTAFVEGGAFDFTNLVESVNIALPTIATTMLPGLVSGRNVARMESNSIINAVMYEASKDMPRFNNAVAELVAVGSLSEADGQHISDAWLFAIDETYKTGVKEENARGRVTIMNVQKFGQQILQGQAETQEERDKIQSTIDKLDGWISDAVAEGKETEKVEKEEVGPVPLSDLFVSNKDLKGRNVNVDVFNSDTGKTETVQMKAVDVQEDLRLQLDRFEEVRKCLRA